MVSLNYKNNVIKEILKEKFDENEFKSSYEDLVNVINKLKIYGDSFYIIEEGKEFISIFYPLYKPYGNRFKSIEELNDIKDAIKIKIKATDTKELNKNNTNSGYVFPILFDKLNIYVRDTLNYDIEKNILGFYYTKNVSEIDLKSIKNSFFQKVLTKDELKTNIQDRLSPIFNKQKKNLKKYSNDITNNLTNDNLKNVSKDLDIIKPPDIAIFPDKGNENSYFITNSNDYITDSSKKNNLDPSKKKKYHVLFDPSHLIQTTKYMNVKSIELTVQNSIQTILNKKMITQKDEIPYTAAKLIFDCIENVANGKAGDKIDIIKEEDWDKKTPELKKVVGKNKNPKEIETLTYINDVGEQQYLNTNSTGYNIIKQISTQPVEIFSPMVLSTMDKSIQWGHDGDMTSKEILNKIFGENNIKKSLISYPKAGEMFFDSQMAIPFEGNYRMIKVSTKGGVDGVGAHASMLSLYNMLFDTTGHKRYDLSDFIVTLVKESKLTTVRSVKDFMSKIELALSPYTAALASEFPAETAILIIFGGTSDKHHESLFNILKVNGFFGLDFSQCNKISSYIKVINNSLHITEAVMKLLNYQKYEIAQVNCLPHIEGNSFWYSYSVQYPAHFNGSVDIERNSHGGLSFHIMASKS